jgi:hypothetical protein
MHLAASYLPSGSFSCLFQDPSAPVCASTSNVVHGHVPKPPTSSCNIHRNIFTAHYCTHSRISVFHSDLPTMKIALTLHTIPHSDMNLLQCRRALIHPLVSGACFEHKLDAHPNSKIERSTCAVIVEELESTSSITAAVLDIILTAKHKKSLLNTCVLLRPRSTSSPRDHTTFASK